MGRPFFAPEESTDQDMYMLVYDFLLNRPDYITVEVDGNPIVLIPIPPPETEPIQEKKRKPNRVSKNL